MTTSANLGFPRLGIRRELKHANEKYWAGKIDRNELIETAVGLRLKHWKIQLEAGIDVIPVNDFSYYDHMLDTAFLVGAIPRRFDTKEINNFDLDTYFNMARGSQDSVPMEMTKWFDTNYHYIVPEFYNSTKFRLTSDHPFEAVKSAQNTGIANPRPVLVGPVTFLMLGKIMDEGLSRLDLVDDLTDVYIRILERFFEMNVDWVQIDEPVLVLDLDDEANELFKRAYSRISKITDRPKIMTVSYFGGFGDNFDLAFSLNTEGLHLDLIRAPEELDNILEKGDHNKLYSLGLVSGRNVWKTNLNEAFNLIAKADAKFGSENIQISPSCSLLHSPFDLESETQIDDSVKEWLAFAVQKLTEVSTLSKAANDGIDSVKKEFAQSESAFQKRKVSPLVLDPHVKERLDSVNGSLLHRDSAFPVRRKAQDDLMNLPLIPTTTIGSFPQTSEIRKLRSDLKKRRIDSSFYEENLKSEIKDTIHFQEDIGLDILVHGEFERTDMVEYFGEQLKGILITKNGWVQSYGSRAVKPPIIYGDVSRPEPMTVKWSEYAQSLTAKPVKGMLTGPITLLHWSFIRDDQPKNVTCNQLALAVRDEVHDLEEAGINVIQIDEPAIREGLPLRKNDWDEYLKWAVNSFRLSSCGVKDSTQIHTHMCYSEFNEIFEAIAALDADVISIEASRSRMELLDAFDEFLYPNDIGPGVYDIHSPRIPTVEEMADLLRTAVKSVPKDRLWGNPDCGLKTRNWDEVKISLKNMVEAVGIVRKELNGFKPHDPKYADTELKSAVEG